MRGGGREVLRATLRSLAIKNHLGNLAHEVDVGVAALDAFISGTTTALGGAR